MPSREALVDHSKVSLIGDVQSPKHIDQEQEEVSEMLEVHITIMIEWIWEEDTAC